MTIGTHTTSSLALEVNSQPRTNNTVKPESENTHGANAESETISEVEPEVTVKAESESIPEVSAEPETRSEVEPEVSVEPKSEITVKAEFESTPETNAEPETGSEVEPEASVDPESEATVKAEPESTPETNAEPETGSEVEPEASVDPESEATVKAEPESTPETNAEPETRSEVEPEASVDPESEATVKAEPESTPETNAEPETGSEVEPEASVDPESETTVKAEPESTPETNAEPETRSEVELEASVEPESEVTVKAESENIPETNAEPETRSEIEPEASVEPESEVTVKAESENIPKVSAEPETRSEAEPVAESETIPEAETTSEIRRNNTSYSEPEDHGTSPYKITAEPEPENMSVNEISSGGATVMVESELQSNGTMEQGTKSSPESEGRAEAEINVTVAPEEIIIVPEGNTEAESNGGITSEPESIAEPTASIESIIIPTILLLLLIIGGLGYLNIKRRLEARRKLKHKVNFAPRICPTPPPFSDEFLNDFDLEVLAHKEYFYNGTGDLMQLAAPALISILQAPLVLYLYPTLSQIMWPNHKEVPNVNDAIACFLMPAGLVYATVFGSAFSTASEKLSVLQNKFVNEVSMIDQIFTLTMKLDLSNEAKMDICRAVKGEIVYLLLQIEGKEPDDFISKPTTNIKTQLWEIVDLLKNISRQNSSDYVTQYMVRQILDHMISLNSICSDNDSGLRAKIHPVKWAFLELLGFFSFFGVALIHTQSTVLSLAICMITVFSISILCFVIADLDNPFSGFFRLDLSLLNHVISRGQRMYNQLQEEPSVADIPHYETSLPRKSFVVDIDKLTHEITAAAFTGMAYQSRNHTLKKHTITNHPIANNAMASHPLTTHPHVVVDGRS